MTWAELLASNNVTVLPTTKAELDSLRSIVARSLSDVAAKGLSTDARHRCRGVDQDKSPPARLRTDTEPRNRVAARELQRGRQPTDYER
jgi:hypothetical protein